MFRSWDCSRPNRAEGRAVRPEDVELVPATAGEAPGGMVEGRVQAVCSSASESNIRSRSMASASSSLMEIATMRCRKAEKCG